MKKFLLAVAVLLAACSSVKTDTPEADCLDLELAQVGDFWGPPAGCERRATVPPNGGVHVTARYKPQTPRGVLRFLRAGVAGWRVR